MLTIFTPTGTQSRLTIYHLLCSNQLFSKKYMCLCFLRNLFPIAGHTHREKVRELKGCPGPQKFNLLRLSLLSLQLRSLDSQGLFYFMSFHHFADFLQCTRPTSWSPGVLRPPINLQLMGRWCRWPGSNVRPEQVAEKGDRKQL